MLKGVADAALLLNAIAGSDPADPATAEADAHVTDFTTGLADASLEGVRIGVLVNQIGDREDVRAIFETALDDLRRATDGPVFLGRLRVFTLVVPEKGRQFVEALRHVLVHTDVVSHLQLKA